MKRSTLTLLAGLIVGTLASVHAHAATLIISDNYNVTNTGTGFSLNTGVNSGINPPTATRLTGSAASGLRYIKAFGPKTDAAHSITNNTKLGIARVSNDSSTLSLSTGTTVYDFGSALNTLAATPGLPSVYDVTISVANAAASNQRCSFALSSVSGVATVWDFGLQLYRANTSDSAYTLQKRISTGASGASALNSVIAQVGTYPNEVSLLVRVTDAGAESTAFSSRIQVSTDGGTTWIYDSSTDAELPSGFRFPGASRFIFWDIAPGAGPVKFDNFSVTFNSGPTVGTRTWTGGGADNNWSTAGNWNGVVPATGDSITFDGVNRQSNIDDLSGLTVPFVTFNNGGFVLGGNPGTPLTINSGVTNFAGTNIFAGDLAWSSTAAKAWNVASGSEVVLSNTTTVEVNGDHSLNGGGTLRVKGTVNVGQTTTANPAFVVNEGTHIIDGGTFTSDGGYRIGSLGTGIGAQTIINNNAHVSLTAATANLRVGDSTNPVVSRLIIDNSTLAMSGGTIGLPYATNASGEVDQNGGIVSGAALIFNQNGPGPGTYNITNGILEVRQISKASSGAQSKINFNNAILRTSPGASNAFFSGLNTAQIQSGDLVIDAQVDVTIAQVLSGSGGLVKSNYSGVTLTGNNTYSGNTVVLGGKLVFPSTQTNTTSVSVADGAEFGVLAKTLGSTLSIGGLNFNGASFNTLSFDLGSAGAPTAPLMKVSNLSVSGPVVINIANGVQLSTGTIVLVDYDGAISGGFQFSLGTLPPGVTANLVNDTENGSIDLEITGVPGYVWTGAVSGDWDYSTQNWIDQTTASPSTFADGFLTSFFDSAATGNVNIATVPTPSLILVSNNTLPYVWSNGALTAQTLKKFGTNSLTRVETAADLINVLELNAGTFVASNSFDASFATVISNITGAGGTFVKAGPSKMTLVSTNSKFTGAFVIQEGTVKMGNNSAFGATNGILTITNNATLDLNDFFVGSKPVVVSGDGVNGQGSIIDSTTTGTVDSNLRDVTMAGNTTFGVPTGGRWDIRVRSGTGVGPGLRGNGYTLTKVGSGTVSIASQRSLGASTPYWHLNLGNVIINAGSLAFAEALTLDNPSATVTINSGASMQLYDLGETNPFVRTIIMTDSHLNFGGGNLDTNILNNSISLTGTDTFKPDQAVVIINGAITGSGSMNYSANEPGRLYLNGVNTYSGDTYVTNGTFGGTGSIAGNLTMLGGTNAPGMLDAIGTFTVNGNLTLGGNAYMELNRSLSPNSDRLVAGGSLVFGGTLTVVLGTNAPAPQAGDVYQLFNKGGTGAFSVVNLPNLSSLPGGLSWDTSKLTVNGTLIVNGTPTPTIGSVQRSGNSLVLSGTGGTLGGSYTVLSSTNIALPVANWTPISTNLFNADGSFSYTNAIDPSMPTSFLLLRIP